MYIFQEIKIQNKNGLQNKNSIIKMRTDPITLVGDHFSSVPLGCQINSNNVDFSMIVQSWYKEQFYKDALDHRLLFPDTTISQLWFILYYFIAENLYQTQLQLNQWSTATTKWTQEHKVLHDHQQLSCSKLFFHHHIMNNFATQKHSFKH